MKILTIRNPEASLVALGIKRVENRAYVPEYRGELGIHVAKTRPSRHHVDVVRAWVARNYPEVEFCLLPEGCLVATVQFVAVLRPDPSGKTRGLFCPGEKDKVKYPLDDSFWDGGIGWIFQDAQILDRPIPLNGRLGIWDWDPSAQ